MSRFLNKKYEALEAYVPGEQPRGMEYIKLNTNESPYPPPPAVLEAVSREELEKLRLYSDPECAELKQALADSYGLERKNVFVSNGSDDILNFAFMAFGADGAVFPDVTYGFYKVFCALHGIPFAPIPLTGQFAIDPQDYFGAQRMIAIANPNAPTGIALPLAQIERIVQENAEHVVLIDEAYVDFGAQSAVRLVKKYDNLLVVHTYSKSRSMAGARLGFAFGAVGLIEDLERIKFSTNPYSVNRMTLAAGTAALCGSAAAYYREKCALIAKTRDELRERLLALGMEVLPSLANFVFARCAAVDGETVYQQLKQRGILVRHFSTPRIRDYNRITIGTPAQCDALVLAMQEIMKEKQQ